jgi:hypothetical protein
MREIVSPLSGFGSPFGARRGGGGGGEPPVTLATPLFFENLNARADGTRAYGPEVDPTTNAGLINANPGRLDWAALRTGAANASRFNAIVFGGELRQRTSGAFGIGRSSSYIISPPATCPTDHYVQWEMDFHSSSPTNSRALVLKGSDENERLEMRFIASAGGGGAVSFIRVAGGTETSVFSVASNAGNRKIGGLTTEYIPFDVRDRLTVIICNDRMYLRRRDGVQLGLPGGYPLSPVVGNRFGLTSAGFDRVDNLKMGDASLAITMNENHRPWVPKRSRVASDPINVGYGIEAFSGSVLRVQPTRLLWALRDPITGALVKDWAWVPVADQAITASSWAANLRDIPIGLNGRNAYLVGFCPVDADGKAHEELAIFSPKHFYVAVNIGLIGQSNSGGLINATETGTPPTQFPGAMTYTKADPPSLTQGAHGELTNFYNPLAGTGSRSCAPLGNDLSQFWNVPVAFEVLAIAARGAGVLGPIDGATGLPNPANDWNYIQTHHAFAGGAYSGLILAQGENESVSGGEFWEVRWQANIAAYRDPSMTGQPPGTPCPVFYGYIGHDVGSPEGSQSNTSMLARAQGMLNLRNSVPDCILAYNHEGAARRAGDTIHYERNAISRGYGDLSRRLSRSIRRYYGANVESGAGPFATGATRNLAVIDVAYDRNGAISMDARNAQDSAIAGDVNALTTWQVSANNFATLLPIVSAVLLEVSPGNWVVRITLASDPGGPVRVRNMALRPSAPTSYPHGVYADGSFIGSLPVQVSLVAA